MTNALGRAEVKHEDRVDIRERDRLRAKAPDYGFYLDGRRRFFVEAKKPAVNLARDAAPAHQLRRYAWTAKLPLSILTDFEELAVYDTRVRLRADDSAAVARLRFWRYDDYHAAWDEIAALLGRDAVLAGSLERFVEVEGGRKGIATVDAEFLRQLDEWRDVLARAVANRNRLSQRDLNFAVQQILDRIIFLRIAEDRGIEPYGQLQDLAQGAGTYQRLFGLWARADARYNSGLFHFQHERPHDTPDMVTPGLTIDDRPLKDILRALYPPASPYAFEVFPADILGQVYEQFLGKVIRLTDGGHAKVEEKPEVRKAGGVYYTPTYIVEYIVRQTVGRLLEGHTPDPRGPAGRLRVLDPACGSGSFLLGAYQYLLDWHLAGYLADAKKWSKGRAATLHQRADGSYALRLAERRRILLDNLYGVDIDAQAVEVTKLSLLLKVLEGAAEQLGPQAALLGERVLPDLDRNVKCGNSLIGPDFYNRPQPALLADDELLRVNAFDWAAEFRDIMSNGGFDAVIGNPPYGADYTEQEKHYFKGKFVYKKGKPETYIYFLEQGLQLLKRGGMLGFITPNAWLTNYYGVQVRKLILENTLLRTLVDLEPTKVFRGAVVDTAITILQNSTASDDNHKVGVSRGTPDFDIIPIFSMRQEVWSSDPELVINLMANPVEVNLLTKLELSGRTLSEAIVYSQGVIPYKTKADGVVNKYISDKSAGENWYPLIENASQVRRYEIDKPNAFVHYGPWLWCQREFRFFERPKILFHRLRKKLPTQLVGAIELNGWVNRHSLSNLILRDGFEEKLIHAVLGLFNSRLANWWFVKRYGLLMEVGGFKVASLPLPTGWNLNWNALADLATWIEDLHKQLQVERNPQVKTVLQRQIHSFDQQIDRFVYGLYGLTEEEVRIVEGE
ncbi:MAG: N-6 DNA methylase [Candidatus Promineofilum sp.]|nr:N-6 DNA methylase [Promineifilum sp.]